MTRLLHLHGGGYVNTIWPKNAFLLGFAAATKRRYGCRLVGTGLGLLPAAPVPELYQPLLAEALEAFDLLEVRDRWALRLAAAALGRAAHLMLGLDDSYLLRREPPAAPGPRTLHLSWFGFGRRLRGRARLRRGRRGGRLRAGAVLGLHRPATCSSSTRLAAACRRAEAIHWQELVARAGPGAARRPHGHRALPPAPRSPPATARPAPTASTSGYYDVKQGSVVDLGSPFRRIGAAPLAELLADAATVQPDPPARRRARRGQAPARRLDSDGALYAAAPAAAALPVPGPGPGTAGGGALRRAQRLSRTL